MARLGVWYKVLVSVESSTIEKAKVELIESCSRYVAARAAADQLSARETGWFVAPSKGDVSDTISGAWTIVVKLLVVE